MNKNTITILCLLIISPAVFSQENKNPFPVHPNVGQLMQDYALSQDHIMSDEATGQIELRQQILIAERHMKKRHFTKALERYKKAAQLDSKNSEVRMGLFSAYMKLHQIEKATKVITDLLEEQPLVPDAWYWKGKLLEQQFDRMEAITAYKRGLEVDKDNLKILEALAGLYTKMDRIDRAIDSYEQITVIDGHHLYSYYILGLLYLQKYNELTTDVKGENIEERRIALLQKAAERFEACLALRDGVKDFLKNLGMVYRQLGDNKKANAVYSRALMRYPRDSEFQKNFQITLGERVSTKVILDAYEELVKEDSLNIILMDVYAEFAIRYGDSERAKKIYKKIVQEDATDIAHYIKLGQLLLNKQEWTEAKETFATALLVDEENLECVEGLADANFGKKAWKDSEARYLEILKNRPKYGKSYQRLFECYRQQKEVEKAVDILKQFTSQFGDKDATYWLLGNLYEGNNSLEDAVKNYEMLLELNPKDFRGYSQLIPLYLFLDDIEKLEWLVELGNETFNENPTDYFAVLGDSFFNANQFARAIPFYEKVLEKDKANLALYRSLSICYGAFGMSGKIESLAVEADAALEQQIVRNQLKGSIFFQGKLYKEAANQFSKALELQIQSSKNSGSLLTLNIHSLYIAALLKQGDTEKVKAELVRLDNLYSDNFKQDVLWVKCQTFADKNNYESAIKTAREIVKEFGESERVQYYMAGLYFENDNIEEAEKFYRSVLKNNPENYEAMNSLGYMFAEKGIRLDEAKILIEKAHQIKPRAGHIIDSIGWVNYQLGNYSEAVKFLEKATRISRPDAVLHDHLGDAYYKAGNSKAAIENWKKAIELDPAKAADLESKIKNLSAMELSPAK